MTLHIISSANQDAFNNAQDTLNATTDDLLFINDGLYNLQKHLAKISSSNIYYLNSSAIKRGLSFDSTISLQAIEQQDFIKLTVKHQNSITWC